MKKLIAILSSLTIAAAAPLPIIACSAKESNFLRVKYIANQTTAIKNLENINEVNKELEKITKKNDGVVSLIATRNSNQTDVTVKVTIEQNYKIDSNTFIIKNALIKPITGQVVISKIKDQRLDLAKEWEKEIELDITNYNENLKITAKSEAYIPSVGNANNYPQKSNVTDVTVEGRTLKIKSLGNKGQDIITVNVGRYEPVKFKVSVYEEKYIENPIGKGKSHYYDWQEANPNRKEKYIEQVKTNSKTKFVPYIDAALYNGDKVEDILQQNKNIDGLTFAFANQDNKNQDKLSISFAGLDKTTEGYKWYTEHKLLPDILKPLASRDLFKNSRVSYGGYNAGEAPEKNLPWILATKLAPDDQVKAQKMLEQAFIDYQQELANLVGQKMVKKIDFDIEGGAQDDKYKNDTALLARTIAGMKKADKEWDFSVTVAVLNDGLISGPNKGMQVVETFIQEYAKVGLSVNDLPKFNPMVMDYGNDIYEKAIAEGKTNFDLAKQATESTMRQIQSIIKTEFHQTITDAQTYAMMGSTPMIGVNDTEKGVFTLEDAKDFYNWSHTIGIDYISMWSINDDRGLSYPIYDDPNYPGGVFGGQPANKSQTSHGLLYLNEYDFTRVFSGDWELV
ncbi:hypothetical protein MENTO_v1c03270 [Mesoplasma entomophilum]|uniref:GH18 domain-containing protein n=1 Tax=Mesoplasma entomophilum TaxID=2149 RepID=A0A3S5XZ11_9MOLU|nr:hypothetical protein [Mesoplasma entomophilum]ATQ35473.1 hypothetical protein CS528_01690 [Mesoplasma entomophilum]ATZ19433.1 hypothetical protein MENTO_v1c03270 [Mesoplasma entomophilum]